MGNKVNPKVMRLNGIRDWQSRWFSKKNLQQFLKEDVLIREYLHKNFDKMGVARVEIERSVNSLKTIIKTAKPGFIIGRGGSGVDKIKKDLEKIVKKASGAVSCQIEVEIEEIRNPQSEAMVMAQSIAEQIEKRMPFRRTIKQALEKISACKDVEGAKIMVKGRLGGNEIARKEWLYRGRLPLHSLRADIDFAQAVAYTTYGTVGIKVWVHKGERNESKEQ